MDRGSDRPVRASGPHPGPERGCPCAADEAGDRGRDSARACGAHRRPNR